MRKAQVLDNELYLRSAYLVVAPKTRGNDTSVPSEGKRFNTRINFNIVKTPDAEPNTARITIYNLSLESRSFIQQFGSFDDENSKKKEQTQSSGNPGLIWLYAGYQDNNKLLFFGDIKYHRLNRQGADITLSIEADDTGISITRSRLNIGYSGSVSNRQILRIIAKEMNLTLRTEYLNALPEKTYNKGYTFAGNAKNALNEIMRNQDLDWSVQSGELKIVSSRQADNVEAVKLSIDTGLIDIPTKTSTGIQAKSLLNSNIIPSNPIVIDSREMKNALFKVTNVRHLGDTDSGDWFTDFEGVSVG